MKKVGRKIIIPLVIAIFFSGCSKSDNKSKSVSEQDSVLISTSEEVTESISEPSFKTIDIEKADGIYIYDTAKVLSESDFNECNNYAEWLNENLMLNIAVVTSDNLNGMINSEYAKKCYTDIFNDKGSGIIILINNDTNKDYIYKHGTPSIHISEEIEKEKLYFVTPELVNGNFKNAILDLLSLSELCPDYVFDNGSLFSLEEINKIEKTLESFSEKKSVSIMTTINITEQTNNELAMNFYKRKYSDNKGSMLFIDKQSGESCIISDGKILSDANSKKINQLILSGNYYNAVETYFSTIGITMENDVNKKIS